MHPEREGTLARDTTQGTPLLALALGQQKARVQGTPPLALAFGSLLARMQYAPLLTRKLGTLRARVQYAPPLALSLEITAGTSADVLHHWCWRSSALPKLNEPSKLRLHFSICALAILSRNGHRLLLLLLLLFLFLF